MVRFVKSYKINILYSSSTFYQFAWHQNRLNQHSKLKSTIFNQDLTSPQTTSHTDKTILVPMRLAFRGDSVFANCPNPSLPPIQCVLLDVQWIRISAEADCLALSHRPQAELSRIQEWRAREGRPTGWNPTTGSDWLKSSTNLNFNSPTLHLVHSQLGTFSCIPPQEGVVLTTERGAVCPRDFPSTLGKHGGGER